jgi:hypothetical protein
MAAGSASYGIYNTGTAGTVWVNNSQVKGRLKHFQNDTAYTLKIGGSLAALVTVTPGGSTPTPAATAVCIYVYDQNYVSTCP